MMRRSGLIHRGQQGFTLIEMTTAIAIVGIIVLGITMAISQVLIINARASNHMIAVRQVQQAGDRVSKDALQALHPRLGEEPGNFPLTLTIPYFEEDGNGELFEEHHTITYALKPMSCGRKQLERSHSAQPTMVVARYVDTDDGQTAFIWDAGAGQLVFKVTATVGGQSETRVYEIKPRLIG